MKDRFREYNSIFLEFTLGAFYIVFKPLSKILKAVQKQFSAHLKWIVNVCT